MIDARLPLALEGGLALPESGKIAVFGAPATAALSGLTLDRCEIIHDHKPDVEAWKARGAEVAVTPTGPYAASVVCLPRAKALARATLATAAAVTDGPVIVDGQKTDGADSLWRELRKRVAVQGPISKAHGKLFWLPHVAPDDVDDWAAGPSLTAGGFWTAPGVFSADGIDPASALLVENLPDSLGKRVVDLGAGWGFLSAHILTRSDVKDAHLVEAGHMALECAKRNVADPRAQYHWSDATNWVAPSPVDAVVMNPPFHTGRAAEPSLGQAFIANAARMLTPRGALWMVANRHLPYETTLSACFGHVQEVGGDSRFKILSASRPTRKLR